MMPTNRPAATRNALSNGSRVHIRHIDGRTEEGRRLADLIHDLTEERGGPKAVTIVQQQAIRRYAQLAVECESMEADRAAGKSIDAEAYGQLADRMDRQARRMGPPTSEARPLSPRERALARRHAQ
ncbi:hypothetical protein M446_1220 [Methylobacterium sp. 4-46]|uniref:hypothetical protein n=1 Tax=unclassified Methylobacterium TaxID=2615210 RepID=UPI000152C580|nr:MULTISPECIES: hypothetical protein [Methylobacterium]ACA15745.1 hypothetical protein M446_1220 [Methylobacterium sp. 4-46]WFT81478.1 hypothetical protein QA634_06205 [Methylobacterium nodulans]